jgi:hypothetical protein
VIFILGGGVEKVVEDEVGCGRKAGWRRIALSPNNMRRGYHSERIGCRMQARGEWSFALESNGIA